ncbi:MAG TPA: hypothetical protein VM389_05665, partial [Phycisphaerae bacterium]|nr:hypothetical protein [Phycisphaerae bacterium]
MLRIAMLAAPAAGAIALFALASPAQRIRIDPGIVTRDDTLKATLRLRSPFAGPGELKLTWTDSYGRTVAIETRKVRVSGADVPLAVPLARAVAMQNFLAADLTVGGKTVRVPKAQFIVTPKRKWDDYQVFMYYAYRPEQQPVLRDLGVNAGQAQSGRARSADGGKPWWSHNYPFYCDQLAHRYYAAYHTPAYRPKHKMLQLAKAAYKRDRTSKLPFYRKPCFHDPKARAAAMEGYRQCVTLQKRFKPFMYATDETGVANLVEAWDFCYDPRCLAAMRKWLIGQYGSLAAIN